MSAFAVGEVSFKAGTPRVGWSLRLMLTPSTTVMPPSGWGREIVVPVAAAFPSASNTNPSMLYWDGGLSLETKIAAAIETITNKSSCFPLHPTSSLIVPSTPHYKRHKSPCNGNRDAVYRK